MPHNEPSGETEYPSPRNARDEAQLMLGQIHGIVWLAVNDVDVWLDKEQTTEGGEPGLTAEDIRRAGAELHGHFGTVHAALNTGGYDENLVRVGLTGAQGQAKKKGLLHKMGRLFIRPIRQVQNYVAQLRGGLRWSGTIIGSIAAALKKEIEHFPGAATAAEAIKEFVEVLLNATEPPERQQPTETNQQPRRQPKGGGGGDVAN